jgi:hypothetical protein
LLESSRRVGRVALWIALITCRAVVAGAADDVVTTTTGERLVGEIQKLEKDVLTFSTGYSDSDFAIEWDKVVSLESGRQFLVETLPHRLQVRSRL